MSIDLNNAIGYMINLRALGTSYSMYGSRIGTDGTADCSGAVYASLRKGGASNAGYVLNTESMHTWLIKNGFKKISENSNFSARRGDVFIWGRLGESGGVGGHTGIFVDPSNVIHCNYSDNGVSISNYYNIWHADEMPYFYIYRYDENSAPIDLNLITIYYVPGYGVNAINGEGQVIPDSNLKLKTGTKWHANGVYFLNGYAAYALGEDLPGWYVYQNYTDQVNSITINYEWGYGINAVNAKGETLAGTNEKFKTGTSWKLCDYGIYKIKDKLYYKVSDREFIPTFYTVGGGYRKRS